VFLNTNHFMVDFELLSVSTPFYTAEKSFFRRLDFGFYLFNDCSGNPEPHMVKGILLTGEPSFEN